MDSDNDDDMAELFSFGTDSASPAETGDTITASKSEDTNTNTSNTGNDHQVDQQHQAVDDSLDEMLMEDGDDSFLKLLDSHPINSEDAITNGEGGTAMDINDPETQDILNWLDEDDTDADAILAAAADESAQKTKAQLEKAKSAEAEEEKKEASIAASEPPPAPVFTSLKEALESSESTRLQILEQWEQQEHHTLRDASLRPLLWSRVICGRTVDELLSSSLVDSFQEFTPPKEQEQSSSSELQQWVRTESAKLAPRIVRASPISISLEDAEESLRQILVYQIHSNTGSTNNNNFGTQNEELRVASGNGDWFDPLLPPVVCAILSAGIPKLAVPVVISHLAPSFMPLLSLTLNERLQAAKSLHSQFYLLACYHLPMLVYHLDRYIPGWYWPQQLTRKTNNPDEKENLEQEETATQKSRHLKDQGVLPPSWLMTHLAGECNGTFLEPNRLLQLWDLVFTNENNSLRFFLVLAILEQRSDQWLELTGDALVESIVQRIQDSDAFTVEEWAARAKALKQATPDSVVDRLRTAEDEAVREALKERQEKSEAALKARLEAEAKAHQEAQERKAEDARNRLTRARLVAFYRRFNPSKEANVDKIMETYKDRFDELDKKLKKKYGVGFNPALNPNKKKKTMAEAANESMKKTMQSMNQGMEEMKKKISTKSFTRKNPLEDDEDTDETRKREHRVSVTVKVGETLPYFCMSREQANDIRRVCLQKDLPMPLRYYLVDSRPEGIAEQQGRFPTAAQLTPETLMDPDALQKYEDSFEGVRGSYHICILGEGQSAIPALYNHRLTPELEEYMREDESRTNNVALFFIKRGFPFVSVLEGGFAAAHAWLWREGQQKGFDTNSILVDYHPERSLFGQMEQLRRQQKEHSSYSSREKTQRALQNLIEGSMTQIVSSKMRLEESLASEAESTIEETRTVIDNKHPKPAQVQRDISTDSGGGLKNLFGRGGGKKQVAAAEKPPSMKNVTEGAQSRDDQAQEEPFITSGPAPAPPPAPSQPQNRFSNWRQAAVNAINQPSQQQAQQGSRFGGFGLGGGFQRSNLKEEGTMQNVLKRNPFARFGGVGMKADTAAQVQKTTDRSGGLMNKVAQPTFSRSGSSNFKNAAEESKGGSDPDPAPTVVPLPPAPAPPSEKEPSTSSPDDGVDFVIDNSENSEDSDHVDTGVPASK